MSARLGLRANWRQFWLLVLVNAFVGAMVGLERTILPLLAEEEFGIASKSALLSFVATFGLAKAVSNFAAGTLSDKVGRKRILVAGWLAGFPVPLLLIWAPSWGWIVFANALLGINQGLAWSTTVVMKIDLVGPQRRGFAMGLNEFAGYLAVAASALATGWIASRYGLRPAPFYLGIGIASIGLALSVLFVRDTGGHSQLESSALATARPTAQDSQIAPRPAISEIFTRSSWRDPALFSASQAGLVNNLNDGIAWGLFPLFFAAAGLSVREIAALAAIYPATWGLVQLGTGPLSDQVGRKRLIAGGMCMQGVALVAMVFVNGFRAWSFVAVTLGIGTAMVYPTLIAAVADVAHPSWRASAVGVYRFWRDMGYFLGAILAGVIADTLGMSKAIAVVGIATILSGLIVAIRMPETLRRR
jgi:MFS family permease